MVVQLTTLILLNAGEATLTYQFGDFHICDTHVVMVKWWTNPGEGHI